MEKNIPQISPAAFIQQLTFGWLDEELKIRDYRTESIEADSLNIIDCKKASVLYYQNFLDDEGKKFMLEQLGLSSKIIKMSPNQYYKCCADKIMRCSVNRLKSTRGSDIRTLEKLKAVILKHKKKLCIPMINFSMISQEGLHRMYVIGELYGWDFKVPVLVVNKVNEPLDIGEYIDE